MRGEGGRALGTRSRVAEAAILEEGVWAGRGWDPAHGHSRMWERRGCDLRGAPFILRVLFIHSEIFMEQLLCQVRGRQGPLPTRTSQPHHLITLRHVSLGLTSPR